AAELNAGGGSAFSNGSDPVNGGAYSPRGPFVVARRARRSRLARAACFTTAAEESRRAAAVRERGSQAIGRYQSEPRLVANVWPEHSAAGLLPEKRGRPPPSAGDCRFFFRWYGRPPGYPAGNTPSPGRRS